MGGLWYEITAQVPPPLSEVVAAVMREAAPGGLALEEPVDILGPEEGYAVRIGEPIAMRAYLPASELGAVLTQRLREALAAYPDVELTARPLYEQDWAVSWREFFGPVLVGRIAIVPTWVEYEASPGEVLIRIDPGQAFGTGHHETTRLCLAALDEAVRPGTRVLEVGAGSGILSIAAARLGAAQVEAFEIDPIAADVARANCEANGVADRVTITSSGFAGPPRQPGEHRHRQRQRPHRCGAGRAAGSLAGCRRETDSERLPLQRPHGGARRLRAAGAPAGERTRRARVDAARIRSPHRGLRPWTPSPASVSAKG